MIRVFSGNDRGKIQKEIGKILGEDYEVFEGEKLTTLDLPSVFLGMSLFGEKRKILVKDLGEGDGLLEKVVDFAETTHEVVVWESNLDKRTAIGKKIDKMLETKIFKKAEEVDRNLAFEVFDVAKRDGARAVEMVEKIENTEDPFKIMGAWVWKALEDFKRNPGMKEKRVLKELSKVDMQMKSVSIKPWTLLKSFLLRLASL